MKITEENNRKPINNESINVNNNHNNTNSLLSQHKSVIPSYKQFSQLKKPTKLNLSTRLTEAASKSTVNKVAKNIVNDSAASTTSINSKEDSAYSSLANSTINSQEMRSIDSSPKQKQSNTVTNEKNDLIMESSTKYFKPILTPAKTQLKSFEIIELNDNNNNKMETSSSDENVIIKIRKSSSPVIKNENGVEETPQDVNMSIDDNTNNLLVDCESVAPTTPTSSSNSFCLTNEFKRYSLSGSNSSNNSKYFDRNNEFIKIDLQTYKSLIEDIHATKILLYKLASIVKDNSCLGEYGALVNGIIRENLVESSTQTE